jgi:uncharacterized membrane protein
VERRTRILYRCSLGSFIALLVLMVAWELWLAPLRPGGSWLVLKAVPLLLPMKGIFAGEAYTYRWSIMLVLAYVAEGCVRAYSDPPPASTLAFIEIALASTFFASAIGYVRTTPAVRRR